VSDLVADFSIDSNPAGPWSYGYSKTLGGQFNRHKQSRTDIFQGVDGWGSPQVQENLWVMRNRSGAMITGNPPTYTIPHDMLHMHPGEGGIFDVVRWTCRRSGPYSIQGVFSGLDSGAAAEADVHVRKNSTTDLFNDVLCGARTQKPFDFTARLRNGDTLDFIVGVGPSGKHWSDSTGLRVTITRR
jgi:hypothetical protein